MVPERIVIADAGPLIALSRIRQLDLLRRIFGGIRVTATVRDEMLGGGVFPGQSDIAGAIGDWLHPVAVDLGDWRAINPDIDPGEASSLRLAERHPGSLLLIDDRAGRLEAQARGLLYMGLAGVARRARLPGLIAAARPLLEALREAGYFLSDDLPREILRGVEE